MVAFMNELPLGYWSHPETIQGMFIYETGKLEEKEWEKKEVTAWISLNMVK